MIYANPSYCSVTSKNPTVIVADRVEEYARVISGVQFFSIELPRAWRREND
jgi:hypothetical protein